MLPATPAPMELNRASREMRLEGTAMARPADRSSGMSFTRTPLWQGWMAP